MYEWMNLNRHIYTDGRDHREGRPPSWMGESIGHWEGDTLIVETVNFNDRTWVDRRLPTMYGLGSKYSFSE